MHVLKVMAPLDFAVDRLEKDRGHFNGPKPQLLTETSTDHLAILLVGSDRTQSQIEFGAHQATTTTALFHSGLAFS